MVHSFECTMKSNTFLISRPVTSKQDYYSWITVVIQGFLKHPQLQDSVGHLLLVSAGSSTIKQLDCNSSVFQSVPKLLHFRGNGTSSKRLFQLPVGLR